MTATDIEPASAAILADDWGDRRAWFEYVVASPTVYAIVAEADGPGSSGRASPRSTARSRGSARSGSDALPVAAVWGGADGGDHGCRRRGRMRDPGPRRDRGGTTAVRAPRVPGPDLVPDDGTARRGPSAARPAVRAFAPSDLAAMVDLDRRATGEDRSAALATFATPAASRVLPGDDGVRGFVIRAPWGGGATVAGARRRHDPPRRATGGDPPPPGALRDRARERGRRRGPGGHGWTEAWRAPRLVRGRDLDWDPSMLWGQFNHAMG